jgi:hypothetical protein
MPQLDGQGRLSLIGRAALLIVTLAVQACVAVSTADGQRMALTSPAFRSYVERVFREQNRVADQIAFALEAADSSPALEAAEQALIDACAGVNELATARRDDRRLGLRRTSHDARSVPACERATAAATAAFVAMRAEKRR